jgi:hypothetical protein
MDNPAARSLMEMVRKLNEMGHRARSGEPGVEDYLRAVSSDPATEWFTGLLREKREELEEERQRADRLARALRAWYSAKDARGSDGSPSELDLQLVNVLQSMGIIQA